ncbi:hypothetical protein HCBAA847_2321 [Helicobacter cinaedi CCUG 18818 = ATCC BAA-847]|uniref:Uncharacterized protein n=1 Tax=Helicobacter cinaedi CCUG 18818 = ATCC BAA-847 TaxID=537971 RepID=A0AAI8QHB4_9HELI|nr:hypothetical protein HCBAA847_2321 [Helicobacter cinaedi CCUG 18818 = ATCC BAA-847]
MEKSFGVKLKSLCSPLLLPIHKNTKSKNKARIVAKNPNFCPLCVRICHLPMLDSALDSKNIKRKD